MNSMEYSWDNPCSNSYQCFCSSSSVPHELELSSSSMESNHGWTDTPENLFAPAMIDSWSDSDYARVDDMLEELIPSLDSIDSKIYKKKLFSSLNQEDIRLATDHPSVIAGVTRPVIDSPKFGLSPVDPGTLYSFSQEGSNVDPPVHDMHFFTDYKPYSPPANDLHFFADLAKPEKLKQETISFRNSSNSPASSLGEPDMEVIAQMKEMMYRAAAFRPVNFDANNEAVAARPRRKNVRISSDPQTVAARQRRERISERIRVLQRLVPGGNKMDTASMLEEAANYLRYLRSQVSAMEKMGKVDVDVRSAMAAYNNDHTSPAAIQATRELPLDHHHYHSII